MRKLVIVILSIALLIPIISTKVLAADSKEQLTKANQFITNSINGLKENNISKTAEIYEKFNQAWSELEEGVKLSSKQAYGDIESKMGMVHFLLIQDPVQRDKLLLALQDLDKTNKSFIADEYKDKAATSTTSAPAIKDLVILLEKAKEQIQKGDSVGAAKTMDSFNSYWFDIEGIVLTKSKKVYDDAEKDMVSVKAYLTVSPIQEDKAMKVIDRMHGYLSLIAGETSYGIIDAATIILREGLEALLVVIALLGFIKKSGEESKKVWVYGGIIIGIVVSVALAVLVKMIFASGTFGNNNFLISGWTGVFAAIMLIYVSYWLHSKSSVSARNNSFKDKSSSAIETGSMFSLGFLAFLAVFREGTETVLFYIGMANSIKLVDLLLGVALGIIILIVIALLMLKVGLKIPMKPFFLISSALVFYLGFKFTGMGINGLQLSGLIPATTSDTLPTITSLAIYPTWQGIIPQIALVIMAVAIIFKNKKKEVL